jgi:tetratricopeptide (TPR) repeat protein
LAQETQGATAEAIETYCLGLAQEPDSPLLQDALAHACYRDGRWAEAAASFRGLVGADPTDQAARLYWGLALVQDRSWAEAEAVLAALSPTSDAEQGLAWYGLGLAAASQGRDADAEAWFQRMLAANPKSVPAYAQLAFLYDRLSRTAEAEALLARGVAAAPDARDLYLLLGAARTDLGDAAGAVQALEQGLKACGENAAMRHQMAQAYDRAGDWDKAAAQLERVIEMEPDNAEALNFLGYTLADRNQDLDKALDLLKRAVSLEPDNPYYLDSLGWAWHRKGDAERARYYLGRALKRMQGRPAKDRAEVEAHLRAVGAASGDKEPVR